MSSTNAIAVTNSSPPPDPSQSPQRRKRILSFDERVAIIVAFTTIGAILYWSWTGGKNKLFSQTWQGFQSTLEDTAVLETDLNRVSRNRRSIGVFDDDDILPEERIVETEVEVIPEIASQPKPVDTLPFSLENRGIRRERETAAIDRYSEPIIVPPPLQPEETTPPETAETPTPPAETTPPETAETPTPPAETAETPTPSEATFEDVPPEHWAYPFIEPLISQELIVGISDNEFQPDSPITRAQLGAEIEQAFKQEQSQDLINFEDVDRESQAAEKINEAVKTGFLKGYPGQVFRPDRQVPRLQVLVALVSGLDLKSEQDPETVLSAYQDAEQIPDWAKEKIAIAIESGLVVNRPEFESELLYPNKPATRAEVVAMIYQALVRAGRIESISSPYIVPNP
ncbi:MAG: S-layer homology domain-containing protein [Xenococcaceae cyanobacterium]